MCGNNRVSDLLTCLLSAVFGAIGTSLGDVATLIQRVEIEMGHERSPGGYDPLERLRLLALRLEEESNAERQGRRG